MAEADTASASASMNTPLSGRFSFKPIQLSTKDATLPFFIEGENVKVTGMSKGKGFQGGVKRHGFSGRNATHGVKHEHRTIGSTGCRFPQHVIKGRKMPGRMGNAQRTVQNLEVVKILPAKNIILVKGSIPGANGSQVMVRSAKKVRKSA